MFPLVLLSSIVLGGLVGYYFSDYTHYLKPFGDIFLNLIFTAIVPLIFFSVSNAIARTASLGKLGKIMIYMVVVFAITSFIAAVYALLIVKLFPPASDLILKLDMPNKQPDFNILSQLTTLITVPNFYTLLSHEHITALIFISILVGIATAQCQQKSQIFLSFLEAGEAIFICVFTLIMYYAPIGFFAYFAVIVSELGPQLLNTYLRIALSYYVFGILYFVIASTVFAYLAGGAQGIKSFWTHVFLPAITAIATCSSAATIPANLIATRNMGVSAEISETVVPLGSILHKDGSVIGGIFKIAFLFGVFHLDFTGSSILLTAIAVSMLVGTVMGAIPSGGMLGELLILSVYGLPASSLIAIAAISIIIDPLATLINVTSNSVSCMLIARLVEGQKTSSEMN